MELNRQRKRVPVDLHRLGHAIWRPADDLDTLAGTRHRLMMQTIDGVGRGSQNLTQPRVLLKVHTVGAKGASNGGVIVLRGLGLLRRQILNKRATTGDVEQLHPTADAQNRHGGVQCPGGERQFEFIAFGLRLLAGGYRFFTIAGGVNITATAEQQTIQPRADRFEGVGVLMRGDKQRNTARALYRVDIV